MDAARAAGSLGARMTGGGFGGSAIALVPAQDADAVGRAVHAAFEARGFGPPDIRLASASNGASRVR